MCWSATASVAMVGAGIVATSMTFLLGHPRAIWMPMGYFTIMEALQAAGYSVVDQCGTPANQTITLLSYLHIVFQPLFVNAFMMELVPTEVKERIQRYVYGACVLSALVMLAQLVPADWAGVCRKGSALCGDTLCLVSGEWHIAWNIPYNGLTLPFENLTGFYPGFPTYIVTVFLMPALYGAWRFVAFHALSGPILASFLTGNPNEAPAIWCLFSIGILLIGLLPAFRRQFEVHRWWGWPKAWQH
jgi:hypothetical protein